MSGRWLVVAVLLLGLLPRLTAQERTAEVGVGEPTSLSLFYHPDAEERCAYGKAHLDSIIDYFYDHEPPGFLDSIVSYRQLSLDCAFLNGELADAAAAHLALGEAYTEAARYFEANQELYIALSFYEDLRDTVNVARVSAALCYQLMMGDYDYEEALNFCQRSADLEPHLVDYAHKYEAFEGLARVQIRLGRYAAAGRTSARMFTLLAQYPDETEPRDWYIAYLQRATILSETDQPDAAVRTVSSGLNIPPATKADSVYLLELRAYRGRLFYEANRYRRAVADLRPLVEYILVTDDLFANGNVIDLLSMAYAELGRTDSAYYYLDIFTDLEIGLYEDQLSSVRGEAAIRYRTEERLRAIEEGETALRRERRIRNLIIVGVIGLVVAVAGFAYLLSSNRRKNTLLAAQNAQNELLLKEIHHRVKNNLETVSSLLELQAATLADDHAQAAMQAGQSRVQSMGLLHQKLYQGKNLAAIDVGDYFRQLAAGLLDTYAANDRVKVVVDVPHTELDVDTAVPLGLIVNELLTNAIKYAFPGAGAGAGQVTIGLRRAADGYQLTVADNGTGKGANKTPDGSGFGTRLVQLLTHQLGGRFREINDGGLRTELWFPHAPFRQP